MRYLKFSIVVRLFERSWIFGCLGLINVKCARPVLIEFSHRFIYSCTLEPSRVTHTRSKLKRLKVHIQVLQCLARYQRFVYQFIFDYIDRSQRLRLCTTGHKKLKLWPYAGKPPWFRSWIRLNLSSICTGSVCSQAVMLLCVRMLWLESTCWIRYPFPCTTGGLSGIGGTNGPEKLKESRKMVMGPYIPPSD
jgi:hypothetical protein